MSLRIWLDGLKASSQNRRGRRAQSSRVLHSSAGRQLSVECLEDRATPAFLGPADYGTGAYPYSVVSGYFNNDTVLDLAVANINDSTVSVLLGNGDGTFQKPAPDFATGGNPLSVAVGDVNGDHVADLVTANSYDLSVLIGNGDGTFAAPHNLDFTGLNGTYPSSVAVGDFTGDGLMDLGVTSNYSYYDSYGYASVLVGDGAGNFSTPNTNLLIYGYFNSATAVNLDGVGPDELVTANEYGSYYGDGAAYVLGADGFGSLQVYSSLNNGSDAVATAVGDVNADGAADIVTANGYNGSVSVMLADGLGGYAAAQSYAAGSDPTSVALGDFTGDGNVDIAITDYSSNTVNVLYGGGDGTFSIPAHSLTGASPWAMAAGDFNGDGWLDAATANTGANTLSVLINDHSWPSPPPPSVSINDASVTEGNIGTTDMTFTVYLSGTYGQDTTVHYATADISATSGSDYTGASGDVTILAGHTSQTFTISVIGDRIAEPTETFAVNLSAPVNATMGDVQGIGTIFDDEPRASVNDVTVTEGNTGSVDATFTVTLSALSDADVTVHYATANDTALAGSDYTSKSGDVVIPHGQISQTFTVAVTGDRVAEPTETYFVNLSSPINAGISDAQGIGSITDDEPRISIDNVRKKEGNGNTTQFNFTVTLSAVYDQAVTVNYATANGTATAGSDYQAKNGTLTFAPGVKSMTVTILVNGDKVKETDETFFVNLSGASAYALISVPQGIGTIVDDDTHGKP